MELLDNPIFLTTIVITRLTIGELFNAYLNLVTKEGYWQWVFYIILIKLLDKHANLIVIKHGPNIIGGFIVTSFRMVKYKPYNFFKPKLWKMIYNLTNEGYKCLCCFLIEENFRNKGVGTSALQSYFQNNKAQVYFTSSAGAVDFYLRNGAQKIFSSRNSVFAFHKFSPK